MHYDFDKRADPGLFPDQIGRADEEALLRLCAERPLCEAQWRQAGLAFFMAGLAMMVAKADETGRDGLLELAEKIYPGASTPEVFATWVQHSPIKACRFLPMLAQLRKYAA